MLLFESKVYSPLPIFSLDTQPTVRVRDNELEVLFPGSGKLWKIDLRDRRTKWELKSPLFRKKFFLAVKYWHDRKRFIQMYCDDKRQVNRVQRSYLLRVKTYALDAMRLD